MVFLEEILSWVGVFVVRRSGDSYGYALAGIIFLVGLIAIVLVLKLGPNETIFTSQNLLGQAGGSSNIIPGGSGTVVDVTVGNFVSSDLLVVTLLSVEPRGATIKVRTQTYTEERSISLGNTLPYGSTTLTLARVGTASAGFIFDTNTVACSFPRDGQSNSCRGGSACCGGTCQELPTCGRRPDGPVFLCGQRQMYCCGGELGFVSCTTVPVPECTVTADCPVLNCVQGPCPVNVCENSVCVERLPVPECTKDADCPVLNCVQAPCPVNVCTQGVCTATAPSGGDTK